MPGPGLGLAVADLFGLRSRFRFRDREDTRDVDVEVELRGRWEEGDCSREDMVEFVVEGGPETPCEGFEGLGNCETKGAWPWDLTVERGTSFMSLSLADLRVRDGDSSSWAALGPPPVPSG